MKSFCFFLILVLIGFIVFSKEIKIENSNYELFEEPNANFSRYGDYNPQDDIRFTKEDRKYFEEVALNSEFTDVDKGIPCRWINDVKIYVLGEKPKVLINELSKIVGELNELINPININIVTERSKANLIICIGSSQQYHNLEPGTEKYTKDNWGLFSVNSGPEIHKGSIFIDIKRCSSINGQKHLLREELTQALGLFNDSYKYENSIFQQDWTETNEYAPIDRRLIRMLYNYW